MGNEESDGQYESMEGVEEEVKMEHRVGTNRCGRRRLHAGDRGRGVLQPRRRAAAYLGVVTKEDDGRWCEADNKDLKNEGGSAEGRGRGSYVDGSQHSRLKPDSEGKFWRTRGRGNERRIKRRGTAERIMCSRGRQKFQLQESGG